jgi:succinate dehydrogenase / fumarate reductase membrane anchor subunit
MGSGTPIGRVRGLGSAREGTHHWLLQRVTAAGNLLAITFVLASFLMLPDLSFQTVRQWISSPLPATAVALLVISVFWHARLGLQVMLEDYVHEPGNAFAAKLALTLASFAGAARSRASP